MEKLDNIITHYEQILKQYKKNSKEEHLVEQAQQLSQQLIDFEISPEEVVSLHRNITTTNNFNKDEILQSLDILMEIISAYGFSYREYLDLLKRAEQLDHDVDVAASLQETMLQTTFPAVEGLDMGVVSKAAKKVNGDYYNVLTHYDHKVSFAIADVIGKGIPAALAMSMIKFGMDSYGQSKMPDDALKRLNRVVERNINQNMFVTMFYGLYDYQNHHFYYSSAGHEPAFFYSAKHQTFSRISTKGIVMGVTLDAQFEQKELHFEPGDILIVVTDGVTELRKNDGEFISEDELELLFREHIESTPEVMVNDLFESLNKLQYQNKKDDLTLFVLKRTD